MTRPGLVRLAASDLRRFVGRFALAGAGIALATAILVALLGLGEGLRRAVAGDGQDDLIVEVVKEGAHVNLGPLRLGLGGSGLDASDLKALREIPGVVHVGERVGLRAPAVATGGAALLGETLVTEVVVEGLDPAVAGAGPDFADRGPVDPGAAPCRRDAECSRGEFCVDTVEGFRTCRPPMAVVVSDRLVELYNGVVRRAYGLPQLNQESAVGLGADVRFGASSFASASRRGLRERVVLAGFSERVSPMALTAPLAEVVRINRSFGAADGFDGAVLEVGRRSDLGGVLDAVEDLGLEVREDVARRVAEAVGLAQVALAALGIAVLVIAGLGAVHSFALLIAARSRELAVLRAVGATRWQVALLVVGEGAAVGFGSGILGSLAGMTVALVGADALLAQLGSLPIPVGDLVGFPAWIPLAGVALATGASMLGSLTPLASMLRQDPARLL